MAKRNAHVSSTGWVTAAALCIQTNVLHERCPCSPRERGLSLSYLVDPASSHMLVSKIKPCMSKYKLLSQRNREWLIKSVIVYLIVPFTWITVVILGLIHATKPLANPGGAFIRSRPNRQQCRPLCLLRRRGTAGSYPFPIA